MSMHRSLRVASAIATITILAACSSNVYPDKRYGDNSSPTWNNEQQDSGILSSVFGGDKKKVDAAGTNIGVNSYLWRASLDTLGFMPLASADPFGGVIITDWYQPPESPNERFKLSVFIMDRTLRADGLRVSVFRQVQSGGGWADAPVEQKTATDMENAILTRARELRTATATTKN